MRNFEQCIAWAVQIGQGTGKTPEQTIARAKALWAAAGDWSKEIYENRPRFISKEDEVEFFKHFNKQKASKPIWEIW